MIASAARTLRLCIMAFSNHCHPPRIRTAMNRAARGGEEVPVSARRHRSPCTRRALTRTDRPGHSGSHLPWLTPQTDLVPDKGQFRSRFPPSAQLRLSGNDFSGSPQPTPTSSQRNTSGRAGWKRLGPIVTMWSRSLGRRVSECWLWAVSVMR